MKLVERGKNASVTSGGKYTVTKITLWCFLHVVSFFTREIQMKTHFDKEL